MPERWIRITMKKTNRLYKAGVPLEEVFPERKHDPKWRASWAEADASVTMALAIAKARKKRRMTQAQLAKAIGTTQSVISRIEVADQNLTIETLAKIAGALNRELIVQFR